jgi:hypothetical protein
MNAMRHAIAKMQRAERSVYPQVPSSTLREVYPQDKALTRFPHWKEGFLLGQFCSSGYVIQTLKIAFSDFRESILCVR